MYLKKLTTCSQAWHRLLTRRRSCWLASARQQELRQCVQPDQTRVTAVPGPIRVVVGSMAWHRCGDALGLRKVDMPPTGCCHTTGGAVPVCAFGLEMPTGTSTICRGTEVCERVGERTREVPMCIDEACSRTLGVPMPDLPSRSVDIELQSLSVEPPREPPNRSFRKLADSASAAALASSSLMVRGPDGVEGREGDMPRAAMRAGER